MGRKTGISHMSTRHRLTDEPMQSAAIELARCRVRYYRNVRAGLSNRRESHGKPGRGAWRTRSPSSAG